MILKHSMEAGFLLRRLNDRLAHVYKDLAQTTKTTEHRVSCLNPGVYFHTSSKMNKRTITLDNMNSNIVKMQYAVRGPLVIRATEIEKDLRKVFKSESYQENTY